MARILNFGSLNIDYVYSMDHMIRPGETQAALEINVFPGGKGLNQSVACARAGAEVYHAGALGQGDNSILTDVLKEAGVNMDFIKQHELPAGHTIIQVDRSGQNSIILFGGSNQSLRPEEIDAAMEHFGPGDYLVMQNETNELEHLMRKGAERGLNIAFNVSPFRPELLKLPLELCTLLFVNEIEAGGIAGISSDSAPAKLLGALSEKLPKSNLVLTLGTRGSAYKAAGQEPVYFGCYKVRAVDTTASGDTYTGFFLNALASGWDVHTAMKEASCAAAISVTRHGAACSVPRYAEVLASDLFKGPEPQFAA